MTKDKALKLALEGAANYIDALGGDSRKYRQALVAPVQSCYCPNCEAMGKELAALKALAAPVQDEFDIRGMLASKLTCWNRLRETEANELVALVASLSQPAPVQEPVAWMFQHDETGRMNYVGNDGIHNPTMFLEMNPRYALVCPLYTTPPAAQRQWVGLTDKEMNQLWRDVVKWGDPSHDDVDLMKAIENKLKERNT